MRIACGQHFPHRGCRTVVHIRGRAPQCDQAWSSNDVRVLADGARADVASFQRGEPVRRMTSSATDTGILEKAFQVRNCSGACTGDAPLFGRTMTLKKHAPIFAQRPAKASFYWGAKLRKGQRGSGGRAVRQDETDARRPLPQPPFTVAQPQSTVHGLSLPYIVRISAGMDALQLIAVDLIRRLIHPNSDSPAILVTGNWMTSGEQHGVGHDLRRPPNWTPRPLH